ncbi:hypothetical protein [Mesorhizobium sp. M0244]|uniref:hypothetical protein n=1 Tax=Mesorhizobium sp. M0244 TaxID=2956926 RepID=UPI00333E1877
MTARYHGWMPGGQRQHVVSRKGVLADLGELPAWFGSPDWRGPVIYVTAEPLGGLLQKWRAACTKEEKPK